MNKGIGYREGQLLIDGVPVLLLAGEIHYYRLQPSEWQNRIDRLKECGMNTVATYVPWLLHEMTEGFIDLDGKTEPRLNLRGFIELCEENGLYIFIRPGPFIMAEMKNDGIPYWVYQKHADAIPQGFGGENARTNTLDYMSPGFLSAAQNWYRAVMGLIAGHVYPKGKIIMAQLDNEVGMLSWVTNRPDFTDSMLSDFAAWLKERYAPDTLRARYPFITGEEMNVDAAVFKEKVMSPQVPYDIGLHRDLGCFMRRRYALYIQRLRAYAVAFGVSGLLFVVNIHGTGGGRGFTYPIGVSQLADSFSEEDDIISGSDVYFEEMKMANFQDMYVCNIITACVNPFGKPLTCVEFNCGDGNFGDDYNNRNPAHGNDFKTRLFIAQGNRLLNYYLFAGGTNWRMPLPLEDGNGLIATTGEHHGFAAPIGPTGVPNYSYPRMARVTNQIAALSGKLAVCEPVYDDIAYGFIAEDFMTEHLYAQAPGAKAMYDSLAANRTGNVWESTVRALLLQGISLRAVRLTNEVPDALSCLLLPSSKYMRRSLQQSLLRFVTNGGRLLLHGRIPCYDDEGQDCRILADAFEAEHFNTHEWKPFYEPAITSEGFLAPSNAFMCSHFEGFDVRNAETLLKVYETGQSVAFYKEIGKGRVIVISCAYKCFLPQYKKIMDKLGIMPNLTHDINIPGVGVWMTMTQTPEGEQFLHVINMDDMPKDFNVYYRGEPVMPGRTLHLPASEALMLPIDVDFGFAKIKNASVELLRVEENALIFRNTEKFSDIVIETRLAIEPAGWLDCRYENGLYHIHTDNRLLDDEIAVRLLA